MQWPKFASSPVLGGIGCIVLAAVVLALGDGLVKIVSAQVSVWQLVFLRSLVALPLVAILVALGVSRRTLWPKRASWVVLRSVLLVAMWVIVYVALTQLTLPVVSAGLYSAPILISIMVALQPGRSLSTREIVGVALGLVGVLILLRPGDAAFTPMLFLPLAGAVLYALAAMITASRCRDESPICLALGMHLLFLLVGVAGLVLTPFFSPGPVSGPSVTFIASGWHALDVTKLIWIAPLIVALAAIAVTASIAMARAYQMAPEPMVAAGDYSYLVFSGFWSLVLFAQVPDTTSVLGMALIALAGISATRGGDCGAHHGRRYRERISGVGRVAG